MPFYPKEITAAYGMDRIALGMLAEGRFRRDQHDLRDLWHPDDPVDPVENVPRKEMKTAREVASCFRLGFKFLRCKKDYCCTRNRF